MSAKISMNWMASLHVLLNVYLRKVVGKMPTRQPVTLEMATKWNKVFKQIQCKVSKCLPCRSNVSALVVLRDKVIHELYDIDDIIAYAKRHVNDFGKENSDFLSEQCFNNEIDIWNEF